MPSGDQANVFQRQRVSQAHDLSDVTIAAEFEAIVSQAAAAIGTPMALLSLLGRDRRRFAARIGITAGGTPLASSFCARAIRGSGVFAAADASKDGRFALHPLVTGSPNIRFYAGVALRLDGARVGTLCVLDDQPRQSFPISHGRYLEHLADRTIAALDAVREGRGRREA